MGEQKACRPSCKAFFIAFTISTTIRSYQQIFVHLLNSRKVLRRIFGPKRDEVTGGWRKLHNEELHNLYSSPSIIRIIKSRRMR
jgi:hypothetical protein